MTESTQLDLLADASATMNDDMIGKELSGSPPDPPAPGNGVPSDGDGNGSLQQIFVDNFLQKFVDNLMKTKYHQ